MIIIDDDAKCYTILSSDDEGSEYKPETSDDGRLGMRPAARGSVQEKGCGPLIAREQASTRDSEPYGLHIGKRRSISPKPNDDDPTSRKKHDGMGLCKRGTARKSCMVRNVPRQTLP